MLFYLLARWVKNHSNYVCFHFGRSAPAHWQHNYIEIQFLSSVLFLFTTREREIWRWLSAKYVHQLALEIVTLPFPAGKIQENVVCFLGGFCLFFSHLVSIMTPQWVKTMRMLKVTQRIKILFTKSRFWLPEPSLYFGKLQYQDWIVSSPSPVGDLFWQSLTLTCWPTLARTRQAATATRPVSLGMETETLRVVITAPPSFCQRPCCRSRCRPSVTSPHRLLRVLRSPGASFLPSYRSVGRKKKNKHPEINLPELVSSGGACAWQSLPSASAGSPGAACRREMEKKEEERRRKTFWSVCLFVHLVHWFSGREDSRLTFFAISWVFDP